MAFTLSLEVNGKVVHTLWANMPATYQEIMLIADAYDLSFGEREMAYKRGFLAGFFGRKCPAA